LKISLAFNKSFVSQVGFVNSLAFAKSAKFLVAGVGQVLKLLNSACITLFFLLWYTFYLIFSLALLRVWREGEGEALGGRELREK